MHKELNYDIMATEKDAAYDMQAKRLLGHKEILAQILIKTVDAFSEMTAEEAMACIEDEIYISTVPVDPGFTNREKELAESGDRIIGLNTENAELNYNDIKKVYSIRVCLGMEECVPDHVHLQKDTLLNEYQ